jgi:PIN domain nuclease of toxin-antitoxin system
MTFEEQVLEKLRHLPPEKQKEVLDLVDFLKEKNGSAKPRRSLRGLWKHLNIHITEEDITEARREMWGNSARDISWWPVMPPVLDTHAAIWYLLDAKNLSQTVLSLIDGAAASGAPTYISAVSLVEVVYLVERGRIAADAFDRFVSELGQDNPAFTVVPLDSHIAGVLRGIPRNVAPDMPDRIIAATALHLGFPLVTRDRRLQAAGIKTIW